LLNDGCITIIYLRYFYPVTIPSLMSQMQRTHWTLATAQTVAARSAAQVWLAITFRHLNSAGLLLHEHHKGVFKRGCSVQTHSSPTSNAKLMNMSGLTSISIRLHSLLFRPTTTSLAHVRSWASPSLFHRYTGLVNAGNTTGYLAWSITSNSEVNSWSLTCSYHISPQGMKAPHYVFLSPIFFCLSLKNLNISV
jgi:hypothetical protein